MPNRVSEKSAINRFLLQSQKLTHVNIYFKSVCLQKVRFRSKQLALNSVFEPKDCFNLKLFDHFL